MKTRPQRSLCDRLGGMDAIHGAVDLFGEKVTGDQGVGIYFHHIEMVNHGSKTWELLIYAFAGPVDYNRKSIHPAP